MALYDGLAQLTRLARGRAQPRGGRRDGVRPGMRRSRSWTAFVEEPGLDSYHLLPSVRGDLLEKLGRLDEARAEFERAALLTANSRQQAALLERAGVRGSQRSSA